EVAINVEWFADRLYYYTSGYPFLVSKLCKAIAEKLLPKKSERRWTETDLEKAVQLLLRENNPLYHEVIEVLEGYDGLSDLVNQVLLVADDKASDSSDFLIRAGRRHGIFKRTGPLAIHNPIHVEKIYNYMTSRMHVQHSMSKLSHPYSIGIAYEEGLNLERALFGFQQFLREQYSAKDQSFLERQWRLIFLAFFKPILNGKGHDFKEVQISDEKRLDVVATYLQHKYIIELKRWYGPAYHQKGLDQLADYLDRQGVDQGYLVIFEGTKEKSQRQEWIEHGGKRVFAVWV
ncbi:MAG: AAA family ATPase, partial [Bacteroidota bacterium]